MFLCFFDFLLDVAQTCKEGTCKTLGDVGYALGGKNGRRLFEAFQIGNLIMYMPVALETVGLSLQYLVDGSCLGWWNIASFVILLVMIQFFKCWHHVAWLAYVTVSIAALKAFVLLPYAFVEYNDEVLDSDSYLGPIRPFGNPNPSWDLLAMACSIFAFTFTPIFILFEVRNDMKDPSQCKKALHITAFIQILMYLVPGLLCVFLWGWNVSNPVTLEIPRGWLGVLLSVVVLLAVALDFCIAAKVTNDWIAANLFPASLKEKKDKESSFCSKVLYHTFYSVPTSAFSLGMVLAIPNFETLIGLLTGITIFGISSWAITLIWEIGGRKYQGNRWLMWIGAIIGFLLTIWVVAAALFDIVTADYTPGFFCSGV